MKKSNVFLHATALACLIAATAAQAADCRINLALSANGGVASQKDNPFGMPASRGNDGAIVTDANFAHTSNADNEWWEVNLGAAKSIAEVRVWLRSDAIYGSRDSSLRLVIYSDAAHSSVVYSSDLPDGTSVPLPYRSVSHTLPSVVTGQVVRIEHPAGVLDYLQINEVQVFNQTVEEVNLALTGFTSQSSTYTTYGPQRANDGVVAGVTGGGATGSTAHSGGPPDEIPWWEVNLGTMQPITGIRVFTSADTPQTRNDDLAVLVLDSTYSLVASNYNAVHSTTVTLPGHDFPANKQYLLFTFDPPVNGQFVQVAHTLTNGQYLVLPEVEVFKAYPTPPSINISQGPTNRTVDLNSSATLSVKACVAGANQNYLSYQWQSNGVNIVGAYGASYTTPTLTELGAITYGVKLILPGYTVTTQSVITVFSDLVPPTVVTNWFVARSSLKLTVSYSELVQPATATNTDNYVFAGGPTASDLVLQPDGKSVTFVVNGLVACDDYSLAIGGVKDLAGNPIVATNLMGTIPSFQINYALDGTATESSNPFGRPASNAIDGDLNTLMHTSNADNEWWELNLGSPKSIGQIALWFRRDCCADRDGNLVITVMDASRNLVWAGGIGDALPLSLNPRTTNFMVAPAVLGQIVRVEHPVGVANYLDFAEVQVLPPASGLCIVAQPLNQAVLTNAPASFSVSAQGVAPIYYQWQHAGTNLPSETGAILIIPKAGAAQAGDYRAVVSNATRTRTSQTATLTLLPPATVSTLLRVNFDGTLTGTAYNLAPGEMDVTGTFAALSGTEVISNGVAILDSTSYGQGYGVTNSIVDGGSGVTTSFLAEMVFIPTAGFEQGTGQNSGYADIFSFGSVYWSEVNHGDAVFALRYSGPASYELRVDAVGTGGTLGGAAVPRPGVPNHVAMVYSQGIGMTNNVLYYYLNGDRIDAMPLANNVGSSSVGSVIAAFGQAVPGSTFAPRSLDGLVDSLVYATFAGAFSAGQNFQLYRPALHISHAAGQATFTWNVLGYVLQQNASLSNAAGWTDVADADASPVSLSFGTQHTFFRLRKQ
jgi:hypothetical protein